ncbi:MAG TPA: leucine--tRNA ligase, partial [Acidilobales archaeon]|nr:leucine--tRNA ligase [Acidilobales archaeon]
VLGVTNIWINPKAEYCLVEVTYDGDVKEKWILACEAAKRLSYQLRINIVSRVEIDEILRHEVINPLTGRKISVLPATFVSPKYGTGVVMSVPAHAPYDYAALMDYVGSKDYKDWDKLRPIPLIKIDGYSDIPAYDAIRKYKVKSQEDKELLDKATKEIYREEFERGVMRDDVCDLIINEVIKGSKNFVCNEVKGKKVKDARENIKNFLMKHGYALKIYEIMNAPVYCRCGTEIVVKLLENQWFINYGDENWKLLAKKALKRMRIVPEEARNQFLATIDWLKAKACARTRGLGTELPWEKGWVIESLSDSTIYMAFYTVIHKIRKYGIKPDRLTREFWDYVMLGKGDPDELSKKLCVDTKALIDIRNEFNYWYPLDSRHSGKDLIPNHLTYFIFNHVAIFPEEKWPKQIVANGWVLIKGEKMAKSKGNIRTLRALIDTYSPDIVRLTLAIESEVEQDLNFSEESVMKSLDRLADIERLVIEVANLDKVDKFELPERWLMSRLFTNIKGVINDLDNVRIRAAGIKIFYTMYHDLRKYLSLVDKPSRYVDLYL